MDKYILAIDQGTTSSRALIFNKDGNVISSAQQEFTQYYPNPGEVEHNPLEIWQSVLLVVEKAIEQGNIEKKQIEGIGITNQRETTVVWNKETGKPIYNAIVWQDRRTSAKIDNLKERELQKEVKNRSGLLLDAYFSASKVEWILDHVENARNLANQGKLAFGTIDSWLIWHLTGGKKHITDVSNASRTLLLNVNKVKWDVVLLDLFNIPESMLPQLCDNSGIVAYTSSEVFGEQIPISGVAGDQQAATFGHTGFHKGIAKNTYGTGCFLISPTGKTLVPSAKSLLSTICWRFNNEITYGLEGSILASGSAITWLRDGLGIINNADEVNTLANSVPDTGDVYFVPALAGLGSPYWDQYARGTIVGIDRGTTKAHIARATLEGIAFQVYDVVKALEEDSHTPLELLTVDGGAARSDFLLQFQADILGIPVERPQEIELTAKGVGYLAGLGVGYWDNLSQIQQIKSDTKVFEPKMSENERKQRCDRWLEAVNRAKTWAS
ncbi:glycerol kinase GlpK [Cyanobacterium aponinum UTEX 3222]|uniref:glycerol kinase GlpK n=1 Tax=Cyanobacterium aponinum TaxID=379064 RepID=UPI00308A25D3|nr:glycerol kinase GlpK [Cyanobacterium aponinum UTEX 3222]